METLINKRFGTLVVIKEFVKKTITKNGNNATYYMCKCKCDCGNIKDIRRDKLLNQTIRSCGCKTQEYRIEKVAKRNKFVIKENYIIGYATNCNKKFIFSKCDFEKVKKYSWHITNGYAYTSTKNFKMPLHRYLTSCPKGNVVDHINHKELDNRQENLRVVTPSENAINHRILPKGIRKKQKQWFVRLKGICGEKEKDYVRGVFRTYKEAKKLRDEIIKKEYLPYREYRVLK